MIIINGSYTIKYSKGGVAQFADFNYADGKLVSNSFRPNWVKIHEIPSLGGLEKIEDILAVIKEWSYSKQAEIILINGNLPNYKSKEIINKYAEEYESYVSKFCLKFFKSEILPIIRKNKWKIGYSWAHRIILIKKLKKDWDNVDSDHKDSKLIDNICNRFIRKVFNSRAELNLRNEHGYVQGDSFSEFFYWVDTDELKKLGVLIEDTTTV